MPVTTTGRRKRAGASQWRIGCVIRREDLLLTIPWFHQARRTAGRQFTRLAALEIHRMHHLSGLARHPVRKRLSYWGNEDPAQEVPTRLTPAEQFEEMKICRGEMPAGWEADLAV